VSVTNWPLDTGADEVDGLAGLNPAQHLHPFALFEVLVVLEEVPDLLDQDLREVAIAANPLVVGM
jgi:hypothetical protein